ncbi:MAG: hypothetical protein COY68_03620 [Candidatus Levybacteria bacterium CG_4_10_14_0_8_um_filter_35_23]|nr:MAG: hypothetical protein COY68_03620 [Candidatus Levybacteria bacterium CG_4_10_14_0_8_um_filter_35_23]
MINILEITNNFGLGGTEKTMQTYCKYLDKKKFNVYACGFLGGGPREKYIKDHVINILVANGDSKKTINFIKENKIKIFHYHNIIRTKNIRNLDKGKLIKVLAFCKENNIKIIETSAFSLFDEDIDCFIDFKLFVSKTNIVKYIWKYNEKVINLNNYSYLYNPIDIDELKKYKLSKAEIVKVKEKYGIKPQNFVVGKLGRADIWKWSDEIIDVVPYLIKEIPNLKIVIRALPKQKLSKIRKMKIENYFILLPETSSEKKIAETDQVMDIMLHTSRIGETFGVAIAEGMFFGIPIVTISTDFMQFTLFDRDNAQIEVVENDKNGFVENSIKKMADKIIYLKKNISVLNLVSKENTKKSVELFGAENIIKSFENMILDQKISVVKTLITEYKKSVIKDSMYKIFKINYIALTEYVKFILLKR